MKLVWGYTCRKNMPRMPPVDEIETKSGRTRRPFSILSSWGYISRKTGVMFTVASSVTVAPLNAVHESVYTVRTVIGLEVLSPDVPGHVSPLLPVTVQSVTSTPCHLTKVVAFLRTSGGFTNIFALIMLSRNAVS